MALVIPKTYVAGEVLLHSDLNACNTAIANEINGGLDNSNLTGTAGITNGNLANSQYEFIVRLSHHGVGTELAVAATPCLFCGLPGSATDGVSYTVISGSWLCTDVGDQSIDFNVLFGYFAATAWNTVTSIAAVTNMAGQGGADTLGQGSLVITGPTLPLSNTQERFIGVAFPNALTNFMTAAGSEFVCTLKIRRTDGLRSA